MKIHLPTDSQQIPALIVLTTTIIPNTMHRILDCTQMQSRHPIHPFHLLLALVPRIVDARILPPLWCTLTIHVPKRPMLLKGVEWKLNEIIGVICVVGVIRIDDGARINTPHSAIASASKKAHVELKECVTIVIV